MIKLFFQNIQYLYELKNSINVFKIENMEYYRKLFFEGFNDIIFSEDNVQFDLTKKALFIDNPLFIDINNKKIISQLIKSIYYNMNDYQKDKILKIDKDMIELLEDILLDNDFKIIYNSEINLVNLISIYDVKFENISYENYIDLLLNYIKINIDLFKFKIVISNNLLNCLTIDEINTLYNELQILDIKLLDIQYDKPEYKFNKIIVSDDLCII